MKELKKIRTDKIDHEDKRFIYRSERKRSQWGLPAFLMDNDRYIPIVEYHEAQVDKIDAFVYAPGSTYEDILLETLDEEELNVFDSARLMTILDENSRSVDKKKWSRLLKIAFEKWDSVKKLAEYEEIWQNYFVDKKAPLKRILHFDDDVLRDILLPLLNLNPGINVLESIATLIGHIAQRDGRDIKTTWKDLRLDDLLKKDEMSSNVKLDEIRRILFEKRYPTIAKYRKEMDEHLKSIPRAAGVDIRSDENFETPGMRLQADLRTRRDIDALQQWLENQKTELGKIIDIQKGNEEI